jgi:hypothetical protein
VRESLALHSRLTRRTGITAGRVVPGGGVARAIIRDWVTCGRLAVASTVYAANTHITTAVAAHAARFIMTSRSVPRSDDSITALTGTSGGGTSASLDSMGCQSNTGGVCHVGKMTTRVGPGYPGTYLGRPSSHPGVYRVEKIATRVSVYPG